MNWLSVAKKIESEIQALPIHEISYGALDDSKLRQNRILQLIEQTTQNFDLPLRERIQNEFLQFGPIAKIMQDESITEILILSPSDIYFEKSGRLHRLEDQFLGPTTYHNFIEKVCQEANTHFNLERPMANGKFRDFRLHIVSGTLTHQSVQISLRRHPNNPWTLQRLAETAASTDPSKSSALEMIRKIIKQKKNFLVVGATASGKTSLLNACLQELEESERCVIIEDTPELTLPNPVSSKLVTRIDAQSVLPPIDQTELLKQSLRMRPDRLVMGEIRGGEAKDLLMALSTGHEGSFATLHAGDGRQALLRLEMLIQMGAPSWSPAAIRNLIGLSLHYIIVVEKKPEGHRGLQAIYELTSVEENGILLGRLL